MLLTSWWQLQKQQQAQDAAAAAAAAEAAPQPAAETASASPAHTASQKNNLVHVWVMVLAGKREVRLCLTCLAALINWASYL